MVRKDPAKPEVIQSRLPLLGWSGNDCGLNYERRSQRWRSSVHERSLRQIRSLARPHQPRRGWSGGPSRAGPGLLQASALQAEPAKVLGGAGLRRGAKSGLTAKVV